MGNGLESTRGMEGAVEASQMQKLILLSVILVTFGIPVSLARGSGSNEYTSVLARFSVFVAVYIALLLFVYPRLF